MSLGSRTCSASKSVSFRIPPLRAAWIEPLPFLYPRWLSPAFNGTSCKSVFERGARQSPRTHGFQNRPNIPGRRFVTNASRATTSNPSSNHVNQRSTTDTDEKEQTGDGDVIKWNSFSEKQELTNQESPNGPQLSARHGQLPTPDTIEKEEGEEDAREWSPMLEEQEPNNQDLPELQTWSSLDGQMDMGLDALVWQTKHVHSSTQAGSPVMPALYEPRMWRPDNTNIGTRTSNRAIDSTPFTQRVEERRAHLWGRKLANQVLKDKGQLSSDWRVPLKLLLSNAKNTPSEQSDGEHVYLPEQVLVKLVGNANAGSWTVNLRSQCQIHVSPKSDSSNVMRRVFLSGTPLSIDLTKDYISIVWAEIASARPEFYENVPFAPSIMTLLNDHNDSKLRSVWADIRLPQDRKQRIRMRADEIERPGEWSTKNFADYIEDITADYMPRGAHRHFYQGDERHVNVVESIIKELFTTSSNTQYFSTRALNRAIWFLYAHRFLPTARLLCTRFDEAGGTFVPETFNIMLMGAARENDLFAYTYTLASMIRLGLKADARAWIALLYTVESQDVRLVVMRYMKRTGLLEDDEVIKHAVAVLVKESFGSHLDDDRDFATYVKLMDNLYGKAWFSTVAGNKMLSALAARGRLDGVPEVLNLYHERDIRTNTATLHQVLILCRELGAVPFAIDTLKDMRINFQVSVDELAYWLLFDMAWQARLHNVCRTVWAYSCLTHLIPYRMQMMVLRSLWKQPHEAPDDPWLHQAGKVIAGVVPATHTHGHLSKKKQLLASMASDAAHISSARSFDSPLAAQKLDSTSGKKALRFQLAREIIGDDLSVGFRYKPISDFHAQLCSAYDRDSDWEQMGLGPDQETTEWMISNAKRVTVGLRRGLTWKNQGLRIGKHVRLGHGPMDSNDG